MQKSKIVQWLAAALFFAAVYMVYTHEITGSYGDKIIGRLDMQSDVPVFYNNIYIFKKKVMAGENPLQNNLEMHPKGVNMAMNSHNFLMGAFCLPFKNNMLGLNIGLLISFVLSGLGAALLCYRFVPNMWLAVLSGFIFAFSPWKMIKLQDHHWFALTAAMPFYIYHFIDIFKYRQNKYYPVIVSYKKLVYCLLLGIVTALSEYYLTFFLLYFSIYYMLFMQYIKPWTFPYKKPKFWIIVAVVITAISTLVSYLDGWGWDNKGAFYWGGDLLGYILPVYKTWVKDFLGVFGFEIPSYQENYFFLGFAFLLFGVAAFASVKKKKLNPPEQVLSFFWLSLLFVIMSMPVLKIAGNFLFYLPTSITHYVPFFNNVRVITRIFILFSLIFPVVVMWYYQNGVQWSNKKYVPMAILMVLLVEYMPAKYDVISTEEIPAEVYAMKKMEGEVVLPMPVGLRDGFDQIGLNSSDAMFFQPVFDKKLIGGYTARITGDVRDIYLQDSVMVQLLELSLYPDNTYTEPTQQEVEKFYKTFSPDIFFVHPKYKGTHAEKYLRLLADKKGLQQVLDNDYLILAKKQ